MPVWADTFAGERYKSAWLTFLILAAPVGTVLGYAVTFYMNKYLYWECSFYLQAIALLPCVFSLCITPDRYLNIEKAIDFKNSIVTNIA